MGAEVVTVERCEMLADGALQHLKLAGVASRVRIETGDGLAPRPRDRFDRILLNGAVSELPKGLGPLLAPGGRLVGGVTAPGAPRLVKVERGLEGGLGEELGGTLRISPLTVGTAASP
jgi:protein-L-isoaspartate(D-aspartate) O-methyltransferase